MTFYVAEIFISCKTSQEHIEFFSEVESVFVREKFSLM